MWSFSFGDICKSRLWLSIARKPFRWDRWYAEHFNGTYNGTVYGVILATPWFVILGHERNLDHDYSGV